MFELKEVSRNAYNPQMQQQQQQQRMKQPRPNDVRKAKSRSSNIVSAITTSQSIPQTVITDDFVKKSEVPPYDIHQREAKRQRQIERSKTKGKNWYHMPAP
ncbi:unnamed protein product, partial [Rotaria sp. Silwood2]